VSGEDIKRVRISYDNVSSLSRLLGGETGRAEFVNLADVDITCVPQEWTKAQGLLLLEIPWEEVPLAFRV